MIVVASGLVLGEGVFAIVMASVKASKVPHVLFCSVNCIMIDFDRQFMFCGQLNQCSRVVQRQGASQIH